MCTIIESGSKGPGVARNWLGGVRPGWERIALERRLAGDRRAGSWSGSRALRMRYDFMRRTWWMMMAWPVMVCLVAPAVLLSPGWMRGYAFGALAASGLWGSAYLVATMSGSSPGSARPTG